MDNASDKKPLLSSNSSRASGETTESKKDSKDSKTTKLYPTNTESKLDSKTESRKEETPVSGPSNVPSVPNRIVRPTAQARPFSTKTKGVYWIFTILHLIALLAVLFAISYGLLQLIFIQTRDGPLYWGTGSFIGGVPSIMFEPINTDATIDKDQRKNIINFNPSLKDSYNRYVDRLKDLMNISSSDSLNRPNCSEASIEKRWNGTRTKFHCAQPVEETLHVNDTIIDRVCQLNENSLFGYDKGTPCILIRLTKILGFFPMSDSQAQNEISGKDKPDEGDSCKEKIKFECTATTTGKDEENNKIDLLVPEGISFCNFPFWNQTGYRPPYIMIRPAQPLPEGKTMITCVPGLSTLKRLSNNVKNGITITVVIQAEEKDKQ